MNENLLCNGLFGKTRQAVLALLYGQADTSFYTKQVLDAVKIGRGTVQRELKNLTDAGIITRKVQGNLVYYRANEKCPIFNELKSLVQKMDSERTEGITSGAPSTLPVKAPPDKLAEFCRKHHIIKLSFFGSVLRDDFRPDSDVDVLVEFEPEHVPGFAIIEMEAELSRLLKRKVDMRTPGDLSRYFRDRVVREARVEYAETKS
jgi:predicted nucleotidyltransferase/predicted transcriptional regulator